MHLSRGIFPGVIRPISLNPVPTLCQLLRWAASPTLPWPLCSVWVGVLCGHRALGFSVASPGPRKAGRPDSNWAGLGERVLPAAKVEQLEYHRAYPSAQARSGGGVRQGQNENCRVGGHGCPVQLSPELDWHCWPLCWPLRERRPPFLSGGQGEGLPPWVSGSACAGQAMGTPGQPCCASDQPP